MKFEDFRGIYKYIVENINIETAIEMHKLLGGHDVTFPKNLYTAQYVHSTIKEEFNGRNVFDLAARFGITERHVRQILHSD